MCARCVPVGGCLWACVPVRVRRVRALACGLCLLGPPWPAELEDPSSQALPEICIGPGHTTGLGTRGRRAQLGEVPTGPSTNFKSFDKDKNCKDWKATASFAES